MKHSLMSVEETGLLLSQGRRLLVAGDEALLRRLPRGAWIGGTIPYFMSADGALRTESSLFVTELPELVEKASVKAYSAKGLPGLHADAFDYGISFLILPAGSEAHLTFACEAPSWPDLLLKPVVGWVSGVPVEQIGKRQALVFDGETLAAHAAEAVVMHLALPRTVTPTIDIVNIFEQGAGDAIRFEKTGFGATHCLVNGERRDFAQYLSQTKADTRLPLVADYCGALINIAIQSVDPAKGVGFYAPVFEGVTYKLAAPVADYAAEFRRRMPTGRSPAFSCNCILNYLYGELEGKRTEGFVGPITFGEIAYQLLNQTLVYVELRDSVGD